MAITVCYKLYAASVGAGVQNAATAAIVRAGRITAVTWRLAATGGAAAGNLAIEGTLNIAAGGLGGLTTVNNPDRRATIFANAANFSTTSSPPDASGMVDNISIPVSVGDTINVGTGLISGTAPTTAYLYACVYVLENS